MQPHEWERVKEVLSAALDRPAGERERFLTEACGADQALRREVDSLLAAHVLAGVGSSFAQVEQEICHRISIAATPSSGRMSQSSFLRRESFML